MKTNVGLVDRVIRIMLGVGIIVGGLSYQTWLGLVGLLLIVSALLGYCPLYHLLGISTQKKEPLLHT